MAADHEQPPRRGATLRGDAGGFAAVARWYDGSCGSATGERSPVEVKIEGFRSVSNEVIFVDMKPEENADYEPLLGHVILEQAQAAVDMLGHRLVPVRYIDMK